MSNTPVKDFLENRRPGANEQEIVDRKPTRLTGLLAPGSVVNANGSRQEIIRIKGASRVRVRGRFTGSGTPQIRIIPVLADGATLAATNIESLSPGTSAEFSLDFVPWGEAFVAVQARETGGTASVTVSYIEVSML